MGALFRKKIIDKKRGRVLGNILLSTPLSLNITIGGFLLFFIVLLYGLLAFEYSKKQTLQGVIRILPDSTPLRINRPGVMDEIFIHNGKTVEKGELLGLVRHYNQNARGEDKVEQAKQTLRAKIDNAQSSLSLDLRAIDLSSEQLEQDAQFIAEQIKAQQSKIALLVKQVEIEDRIFKSAQLAFANNSVSQRQLDSAEKTLIAVKRELESERTNHYQLKQRRANVLHDLQSGQLAKENLIVAFNNEKQEIENQIEAAQFEKETAIIAPVSGIVKGLRSSVGEEVGPNHTFAVITPTEYDIYMELVLPTNTSSNINVGDKVKVYVNAYPYQEYGFLPAFITSLSPQVIMPSDVEAGLTISRPSFIVRLDIKNLVTSSGNNLKLKNGMGINADIIIDKRTILDWVLEPFYDIKGKR